MVLAGGIGGTNAITDGDDMAQLCQSLRGAIQDKSQAAGLNNAFAEFRPVSYKSQVVAGANYFVKVHLGGSEYVHARIFKPLPNQGDSSVHSVQVGKTQDDDIVYF